MLETRKHLRETSEEAFKTGASARPWRPSRAVFLMTLVILAVACSSSTLSLPEYVERLNAIVAEGNAQIRPLYAELDVQGDPELTRIQKLFEEEAAIRADLQDSLSDIEAPDQIAELHAGLVDWHQQLIENQRSLADVVVTASSWSEFTQTPEYAAFDEFMQEGLAGCLALQATLDSTEARGAFADTPWIPGDLKEVVDAALGCDSSLDE